MKKILLSTIAVTALTLVGCSNTNLPALNLASIQAQAVAIENGINEAATLAEADPQLSPTVVAKIKTSVAAFDGVTNTLVGLPSTAQTGPQIAAEFATAAESVVAVLPIDPTTKAAIEVGLALVNDFAAGMTVSPVPATVIPANGAAKATLYGTPIIEIPAPTYVPTK